MFGRRYPIFRILGIEVRIDASWILIAALMTWTLARGLFPERHPELDQPTYLLMGVLGAAGLFASIIVHELAHAVVALRCGVRVDGITLFLFGGVVEMHDEPQRPRDELAMAAAGPIASFVLGVATFAVWALVRKFAFSPAFESLLEYLGGVNILIAIFNALPAFPLDGGRVLRALIWGFTKDLEKATRIATTSGSVFACLFLAAGAFDAIRGELISGMWWAAIGLFVHFTARSSYRAMLARRLAGHPVHSFMRYDPIAVPAWLTVQEFVDRFARRFRGETFPVAFRHQLIGYVDLRRAARMPRGEWRTRTVAEIAVAFSHDSAIDPDADAAEALTMMHRSKKERLLVVRQGRLLGVIALKDMARFLSRLEPRCQSA